MYIVRAVLPTDLPHWLAMRRALWPDAAANVGEEISTYVTDGCIGGVPHGVFLAERLESPHLVGFIEVSVHAAAPGHASGPVGYVEGWYVEASVRRAGVGRRLLHAGEAWCRQRGCTAIASDTTTRYVSLSVPSHLACGFRIVEPAQEPIEGIVHFIKVLDSAVP